MIYEFIVFKFHRLKVDYTTTLLLHVLRLTIVRFYFQADVVPDNS